MTLRLSISRVHEFFGQTANEVGGRISRSKPVGFERFARTRGDRGSAALERQGIGEPPLIEPDTVDGGDQERCVG